MNDHLRHLESRSEEALKQGILSMESLSFYRALYGYLHSEYERYARSSDLPHPGPEGIPMATRGRSSLFREETARLLHPGLDPLLEILTTHYPGLELTPLRDVLAGNPSKWMELAGALLDRDAAAFEAHARACKAGGDELVFIVTNWLKPLFIALAESHGELPGEEDDTERSCPFCGYYPEISLIVKDKEGKRHLVCSLCETRWPYKRIACTVCGTENAEELEYLSEEGTERHRIDLCHSCQGYIKTVRIDKFEEPEEYDPVVENLLTVHLDSAALKRGYHRP